MNFNFNDIIKKMGEVQSQLMEEQNKQKDKDFIGVAFGGRVSVTMNYVSFGNYKVKKVIIDKSLLVDSDIEILEDSVAKAFNDAMEKANESSKNALSGIMPTDFKLPF